MASIFPPRLPPPSDETNSHERAICVSVLFAALSVIRLCCEDLRSLSGGLRTVAVGQFLG